MLPSIAEGWLSASNRRREENSCQFENLGVIGGGAHGKVEDVGLHSAHAHDTGTSKRTSNVNHCHLL